MIYDIQKASLLKRISAFLLDIMFMAMCILGFALLLSTITDFDNYSKGYYNRVSEIQEAHNISEISEKYNLTFSEYSAMTDEEKNNLPQEYAELVSAFENCISACNSDAELIKFDEIRFTLALFIGSFALLLSFLVLEFAIPMIFKNGQTLGKKLFSIAVIRVDCVKVSPFELFVRSILGKYTIETMVPCLMLISFYGAPIMSITVLLLIALLQIVMIITTKTNSLIHDKLASTVVVDLQSQMIFDSVNAMKEYKLKIHKEQADKAQY